jgi:hypothetical protein
MPKFHEQGIPVVKEPRSSLPNSPLLKATRRAQVYGDGPLSPLSLLSQMPVINIRTLWWDKKILGNEIRGPPSIKGHIAFYLSEISPPCGETKGNESHSSLSASADVLFSSRLLGVGPHAREPSKRCNHATLIEVEPVRVRE